MLPCLNYLFSVFFIQWEKEVKSNNCFEENFVHAILCTHQQKSRWYQLASLRQHLKRFQNSWILSQKLQILKTNQIFSNNANVKYKVYDKVEGYLGCWVFNEKRFECNVIISIAISAVVISQFSKNIDGKIVELTRNADLRKNQAVLRRNKKFNKHSNK